MEADSSSAYLYGAHCEKGSKVIALVSEANRSILLLQFIVLTERCRSI